jgi:hypothetical protein
MIGMEMAPETSVSSYNQLTRLIARVDIIDYSCYFVVIAVLPIVNVNSSREKVLVGRKQMLVSALWQTNGNCSITHSGTNGPSFSG